MDFGFSDYQAAPIVGNLIYESHDIGGDQIDPRRREDNPPCLGAGIAQWSFGGPRWTYLVSFAKGLGESEWSLSAQLAFVVQELSGNDSTDNYYFVTKALNKTTNIQDATERFMTLYENPSVPTEDLQGRIADAQMVLATAGTG